MKKYLLLMLMIITLSGIFAQGKAPKTKWRSTEMDTMTVAQAMFDDQNFNMAYPYISQLQKNHPQEGFLKYMTGICSLFRPGKQAEGLSFLQEVYKDNKKAEDIEFYLALAYHYNSNFVEAVVMVDKYLGRKTLSKAQRRVAEKLKEYCREGKMMEAAPDEGTIDDYIQLAANDDEASQR
ncbi:MAG: hypothetical protein ACJ77K_15815 [Bacteroidia bacterium]